MYRFARAGVQQTGAQTSFAPPSERLIGNNRPPWTGSPGDTPDIPAPHPPTQPMGGNVGNYDGYSGSDPAVAEIQPHPHVSKLGAEQETFRRYGLQGFNDQLQYRDRHAYWARGSQRSGIDGVPHGMPNTYNPDLRSNRPTPELRTINVSVNPQIGSDASRNQDDLSRPYTWLGQWDGTVQPVYGGVPGLWQSYGNRGLPSGIHDPSNGEGGPALVYSGPPHGLHSDTLSGAKQVIDRYKSTPQMQPVRIDRPSNSTIAGQSYSQTVKFQGQTSAAGRSTSSASPGLGANVRGRGWAGGA